MNRKTTIILTRPQGQNEGLQKKLEALNFATRIFPLLQIEKISARALSQDCDFAIFTSSNAVKYFPQRIKIPVFAVGSGTQTALAKKNIVATIPEQFSSEGLLDLPELQNIQNKKIAIICGENPRLLLAETLEQRGAQVETIFCYRRLLTDYTRAEIEQICALDPVWIIVTSAESLANLLRIFTSHTDWLYRQQLFVSSLGLKAEVERLGFQLPPMLAKNASDEAFVELLLD